MISFQIIPTYDMACLFAGGAVKKLKRHSSPSFPIATSVSYKLLGVNNLSKVGKGQTIAISSKLVTFAAQHELPSGAGLELMIEWPALLRGSKGIVLILLGVVTCRDQSATTMEIVRWELRTKSEVRAPSVGKRAGLPQIVN